MKAVTGSGRRWYLPILVPRPTRSHLPAQEFIVLSEKEAKNLVQLKTNTTKEKLGQKHLCWCTKELATRGVQMSFWRRVQLCRLVPCVSWLSPTENSTVR